MSVSLFVSKDCSINQANTAQSSASQWIHSNDASLAHHATSIKVLWTISSKLPEHQMTVTLKAGSCQCVAASPCSWCTRPQCSCAACCSKSSPSHGILVSINRNVYMYAGYFLVVLLLVWRYHKERKRAWKFSVPQFIRDMSYLSLCHAPGYSPIGLLIYTFTRMPSVAKPAAPLE